MDSCSLEELLRHRQWVSGLALGLVRDTHAADDLAQDAWVTSLESPPREPRAIRSWFRRVMTNRVREEHRTSARRDRREHVAARSESVPSESELLEKVELERRVVRAVMALESRYREVILLRYFHDLTPTAIAEHFGCPVKTVKTRLSRALDRLRESLDPGDRQSLAILLPLSASQAVTSPSPALAPLGGMLVMNWKLALSALLLLILGVWWGLPRQPETSSPEVARREASGLASPRAPSSRAADVAGSGEPGPRVEVAEPGPSAGSWSGRLVDAGSGAPIVGARVGWVAAIEGGRSFLVDVSEDDTAEVARPGEVPDPLGELQLPFLEQSVRAPGEVAITDADGRFTVEIGAEGFLRVRADGYRYAWTRKPEVAAEWRLEPALRLVGRFRDPDGGGPRGGPHFTHFFVQGNVGEVGIQFRVVTDEDGRFDEEIPDLSEPSWSCHAEGYRFVYGSLPRGPSPVLLERVLDASPFVGGEVVDETGQPVSDVEMVVSFDPAGGRAEFGTVLHGAPDGRFFIGVPEKIGSERVRVRFDAPGHEGQEITEWRLGHDDHQIVLATAHAGRISGRVLLPARWHAEEFQVLALSPGASRAPEPVSIGADGAFDIPSVEVGSYILQVIRPVGESSMHFVTDITRTVGVEEGQHVSDIELRIEATGVVEGTVRSPDGEPMESEFVILCPADAVTRPTERPLAYNATGSAGGFEFLGVKPGTYGVVWGMQSQAFEVIEVDEGGTVRVDFGGESEPFIIRLERGSRPVVGAALIGVRVASGSVATAPRSLDRARGDEEGIIEWSSSGPGVTVFHITDPSDGKVMVWAQEFGTDPVTLDFPWPTARIELDPGELASDGESPTVALRLQSIAGIDLTPVVPAPMRVLATSAPGDATREPDGRIIFREVSPGHYDLIIGERTVPVDVDIHSTTVEVRLD